MSAGPARLSPHFTVAEFEKSPTAERRGLTNVMNPQQRENAALLCQRVLEPVRAHFGGPVVLTSGFRSRLVNLAVGSKPGSQHESGEAADFERPGIPNPTVAIWIRDTLDFDQLILEFHRPGVPDSGWVHVSYREGANRKQVLTIGPGGTKSGLVI